MSIPIENLKSLLREKLEEELKTNLPYFQEHDPDNSLNYLLEIQNTVLALIELEALEQSDIDEGIDGIEDGTNITATVRQIAWKRKYTPAMEAVRLAVVNYNMRAVQPPQEDDV